MGVVLLVVRFDIDNYIGSSEVLTFGSLVLWIHACVCAYVRPGGAMVLRHWDPVREIDLAPVNK